MSVDPLLSRTLVGPISALRWVRIRCRQGDGGERSQTGTAPPPVFLAQSCPHEYNYAACRLGWPMFRRENGLEPFDRRVFCIGRGDVEREMSSPLGATSAAQRERTATQPEPLEGQEVVISVVMPCLNEEETIGACVAKALEGIRRAGLPGEVIVSDNGSTDRSVEIAEELGARVVHQPLRGYGNAYRKGFDETRGKYIIMGDSDDTYDFTQIPEFVQKLQEGNDYVLGSRFKGEILPGAMP